LITNKKEVIEMDPIELLISEHDNIKRMLKIMRQLAIKVLNTGEVNYDAFYDGIDFVRDYADSHHHGKEEDILFEEMVAELDQDVEDGPIEAMFSEHDLGRYFINNLEEALKRVKLGNNDDKVDIIANTVAYVDLLEGHIYKENNIVYNFAKEELSDDSLEKVKKEAQQVEEDAKQEGIQDKYLEILEKWEEEV